MFVNNRPDALGLIGRAIGQQAPLPVQAAEAVQPVQQTVRPATAVAVSGAAAVTLGSSASKAEAETAQLKTYLANITKADPGMVIALTEQAARNTARNTYDAVVSSYAAF